MTIFEKTLLELFYHSSFFIQLLVEHLEITAIAVVMAIVLGLGIGVFVAEKQRWANGVIALVNVLYTIPSIALLGVLISLTGIGNVTAVIALTVYGLLPIVRSTYMGITTIDAKIIEASDAMGSRWYQTLLKIKLPLAFPHIFSALRDMVIMTIALTGIASFVGAGGLGVAIYRGITTNNDALILAGSLLIALLALLIDFILGRVQKCVWRRKSIGRVGKKRTRKKWWIGIGVLLLALGIGGQWGMRNVHGSPTIKMASKPTTEGYILAEIIKAVIEQEAHLSVDLTHGVGGGTSNIQPAVVKGEFDLYPEYTGTAWQIVLKEKKPYTAKEWEVLKAEYAKQYQLEWLGMFGFNNTYSLGVNRKIAEQYHLHTFSDLARYAPTLTFGAEYDFFEREDGFSALSKAYGLHFKKVVDMDNGLKYKALFNGKLDVITVFTTDGQLADPRMVVLTDDRSFYPQYRAGIVVRKAVLQQYPILRNVLGELDNTLTEKMMSELNYRVEVKGESPQDVAHYFITKLWKKS